MEVSKTRFLIEAIVDVDVQMEIEAESAEAAKQMFLDGVIMTAGMADLDHGQFDTLEDSIADIRINEVRPA